MLKSRGDKYTAAPVWYEKKDHAILRNLETYLIRLRRGPIYWFTSVDSKLTIQNHVFLFKRLMFAVIIYSMKASAFLFSEIRKSIKILIPDNKITGIMEI